ncbi:MAG: hypothetical protein A2087_02810 [Spirochaetes bacterium GWD1_61_31]|nr:MAG: hypothetical protein A2Y37_09675 [Spirochaetes bacterium GWB1_60_80]OHD31677.1 MAG: hypothetical protein A2004_03215 [Spirochaetes bacterium GWC1_61_12]OHD41474.1 MAG: hypothetical protein A2Y35_05980 [Spirochaetes bacterium GWE1_60_18]OHD41520.1 MAG: hypothetical protein A2087_02810 [Spirochaetes bacterium GWD1_61_31]OHD61376.1 MAG: hypothetical protein A2Y32_04370 [Spirochaetes bacterium GWF1_60_12]HAP42480.1 hypothetical protein [Spirochaetaceae bacterium]
MKPSYHHKDLRKQLVSAGLRQLNRDGLVNFSMRRLAQDLGVSHAAAYRHFASKEALLAAIFLETSAAFRAALSASLVQPPPLANASSASSSAVAPPDASVALTRLGRAYVRFFLDNPEALGLFSALPEEQNLMLSLIASLDGAVPATASAPLIELASHAGADCFDSLPDDSAFGLLRGLVRAIRGQPAFRHLSEREVMLGYWAKVHGLASLLVTQKNFLPPDQLDASLDRLLETAF